MSDIEEFLDALYGDSEGWVYVPVKAPNRDKDWVKHFFHWPRERGRMVNFIQTKTETHEVYIAPALFREDMTNVRLSKEAWKETQVLWAEFDGNAPDTEGLSVPPPTIRVRSSYEGHEHWYWRLPTSEHSPTAVESLNRRLAYELGADKSGFDYQQVLRPPGTKHHKSGGQLRTALLVCGTRPVPVARIVELPEPPVALDLDIDVKTLPKIHEVVAYNNWDADTLELIFEKKPKPGKISDSMFRLASDCFKKGMKSSDVLALMIAVDGNWGKFKGRSDRFRRLKGLVVNAKSVQVRNAADPDKPKEFITMRHLIEDETEIDWIIPDYLYRGSLALTNGKGSVGKTQFNLQTAIHLCIGKPYLKFNISKPHRIAFVSLEMDRLALKQFLTPMIEALTEDELELFYENFRMFFPDEVFYMNEPTTLGRLLTELEHFGPDGVIVDSLGVGTKGDIKVDEVIINLSNMMKYQIQKRFNCFVWFIHHNRKATGDNKKPKKAEDIFGSVYIYNTADTIIGMWRDDEFSPIEVYCLKMRMAPFFDKFFVRRTDKLNFETVSPTSLALIGGANGNRDPGPEAEPEPGIDF